ncbi:hypothetical protein LSH36_291g04000 [Paralvinella palmiformis]|uniref:Uncharacterized protein n=1 Tax=Paralvinella palmiformis TaxID=53620 RepID=A0AAD9N3G1_9ANNE|nr:hypothetical protein LSH36_291g04000 [Paralvinella palmiformis]
MDSDSKHRVLDLCGQGGDVKGHLHPLDDHTEHDTNRTKPSKKTASTLKSPPGDDDDGAGGGIVPDSWESIVTDELDAEYGSDEEGLKTVISLNPKLGVAYLSLHKSAPDKSVFGVDKENGHGVASESVRNREKQQQQERDVPNVCTASKLGECSAKVDVHQGHCSSVDNLLQIEKVLVAPHSTRCCSSGEVPLPGGPLSSPETVCHDVSCSAALCSSEGGESSSDIVYTVTKFTCQASSQITVAQHHHGAARSSDCRYGASKRDRKTGLQTDSSEAKVGPQMTNDNVTDQKSCVQYHCVQTPSYSLPDSIVTSTCYNAFQPETGIPQVAAQSDDNNDVDRISDDNNLIWEVAAVISSANREVSRPESALSNTDSEADEFFSLDDDDDDDGKKDDGCRSDGTATNQMTPNSRSTISVKGIEDAVVSETIGTDRSCNVDSSAIGDASLPAFGCSQISQASGTITVNTAQSCVVSSNIKVLDLPSAGCCTGEGPVKATSCHEQAGYYEGEKTGGASDGQTGSTPTGNDNEILASDQLAKDHCTCDIDSQGKIIVCHHFSATKINSDSDSHTSTQIDSRLKDKSPSWYELVTTCQSGSVTFTDNEDDLEPCASVRHVTWRDQSSNPDCQPVNQNRTKSAKTITVQYAESAIRDYVDSDVVVVNCYPGVQNRLCLNCTSSEAAQSPAADVDHSRVCQKHEAHSEVDRIFLEDEASKKSVHRLLPCTVMVTDTDANVTNTLDLDSLSEYGGNIDASARLDLLPCANTSSSGDGQLLVGESDVGLDNVLSEMTPDVSTDEEASEDVENDCMPYYEAEGYNTSNLYDGYMSYSGATFGESIVTSGDTITESTVVYTDSTVAGIDTLLYGKSSVPVLTAPSYAAGYDLSYGSDTESCMNSDGTSITDPTYGSVMVAPPSVPTCPHGYPAVQNTPVIVHTSEMSMCSPPPDSSILAGVYSTIAPLRCTLTPDCPVLRQSSDSTGDIPADQHVSSRPPEHDAHGHVGKGGDYHDLAPSLECSGYSANSHITMATIPNTTATIPAVITATSAPDCDAISSPTTSLQFRVQLKEFAFVGSCLKIAAKVSVTEEDADFWKHMHPGDVYFFSANSYVLCVQRSKQKVRMLCSVLKD